MGPLSVSVLSQTSRKRWPGWSPCLCSSRTKDCNRERARCHPRNRGFFFLDSHPAGCEQLVADMWQACPAPAAAPEGAGPVALIIGSSAGYGLAATLAGLKRAGIRGIMVSFEKAPTERRTATAGWYRTADIARTAGRDLERAEAELCRVEGDEVAVALRPPA
ncbi:hypothetical protein ACFTY8_32360 [Streptomyces mirabilis]|uniref:hypothetical protein n=1 Tax=Streptomyces mirabilis TaxID=68239 RepID=UPI0036410014